MDVTERWYTKEIQEYWDKDVNYSLWSTFEKFMGNPNTSQMIEQSKPATEGMPPVGIRYCMDLFWKERFGFINKLHRYVKEWIESVDTSKVICRKKGMVNSTDFYFSFNYTDVLERVYGIESVLHIHGGVASVCDVPPIMGHSNEQDIQKYREWAKEAANEFDEANASIMDAVADYLETIYKDTKSQIRFNKSFFNRLSTVNRVIIMGWSAGEADIPYLQEIIKNISHNTRWTVYWYNKDAYNSLENVFKKESIVDNNVIEYIQSDAFWSD
mgnify:CR=1 FL=1